MAFVAISIDLCGSTHVKQRIVQLSKGDVALRRRMFAAYKSILYNIERSFYLLVLEAADIDFDRLMLIKSIGDELWYAYRLDESDPVRSGQSMRALVAVLLRLISDERTLTLSYRGDIDREGSGLRFEIPIKVYADLIEDCEELNTERYEHLKEVVAASRGMSSAIIEIDEAYLEICDRLNLGVPDTLDGRHDIRAREDFIGFEVDRFFRLTKQCLPRLLTVGKTLFDRAECKLEPAARDYEHLDLKALRLDDGDYSEPIFAIRQHVASSEMKGISEDYAVFHLFDFLSLGEHFDAPSPVVDGMMNQTRAYLAEKGFFAVINRTRATSF